MARPSDTDGQLYSPPAILAEVPMRTIGLVILAFSLALAPLVGDAQQAPKVWRIGFLGAESASTNRHSLDAFRLGMSAPHRPAVGIGAS